MSNSSFENQALFEHRFWLQVLGDHGRFIYNTLSPSEREKIEKAEYFISIFDRLLEKARGLLNTNEINDLTSKVYVHAKDIREFKLDLLREHLVGKIIIGLSPTLS